MAGGFEQREVLELVSPCRSRKCNCHSICYCYGRCCSYVQCYGKCSNDGIVALKLIQGFEVSTMLGTTGIHDFQGKNANSLFDVMFVAD